jgi:hypothetical protein
LLSQITTLCLRVLAANSSHRSSNRKKVWDMRSNNYLIVLVLALLAACSSTPTTHTIVPSRTTIDKIVELNHRSDVIVDILTVDRTEHRLQLNGAGGSVLSGRDLSPDNADQMIEVPIDQLALVYYAIDANKQRARNWQPSREYPLLPPADPQDRTLSCEDLDLGVSRTGTIRWNARMSGANPFTAHGARVQHATNAARAAYNTAIGVPFTVMSILMLQPAYLYWESSHAVSVRWSVTAADRREIGLLEIKRDRSCPALPLPGSETTDLDILEQIESTRADLAVHRISEQEQMNQQTKLLDQFDPPAPRPDVQAASTSP